MYKPLAALSVALALFWAVLGGASLAYAQAEAQTPSPNLQGTWLDSDGDEWTIESSRLNIAKDGVVVLNGELKTTTGTTFEVETAGGKWVFALTVTARNVATVKVTDPANQVQELTLQKTDGPAVEPPAPPTPQPTQPQAPTSPTPPVTVSQPAIPFPTAGNLFAAAGNWEYLDRLLVLPYLRNGDKTAWYALTPVVFEGKGYMSTYQKGPADQATLELSGLLRADPKSMKMVLGVDDDVPTEAVYKFTIRLDDQSPIEHTIRKGVSQEVSFEVSGVSRLLLGAQRIEGPAGGRAVIVHPQVFY